jgi:hypothetical protein
MPKLSRHARRTVLGASVGVAVVGAAVGAAGFASAAPSPAPTAPGSTASASARPGPGGRGHGLRDDGPLARELAGKLNLDQTKVAAALKEVRDAKRPTTKPTPTPGATPTRPDRAADDAALAKALAPRLGVDEAKIKTALDEIRAAGEADRTKALDDRLAAAVTAGTLTQAEADAVKKAAAAGVIDVGPR